MSYFSQALKRVLDTSFNGKQQALEHSTGLAASDCGRLIREESPVTAVKLAKLCAASEISLEDQELLVTAAVRDFVPEALWQKLFHARPAPDAGINDATAITIFADFPISPRALQVLRYLVSKAQSDPDVTQALELLGKFLELPGPLE